MTSRKSRGPRRRESARERSRDKRKAPHAPRERKGPTIISPRDERGTPYPGDFPNPLHRVIKGCF
jgi:hypothetical protein